MLRGLGKVLIKQGDAVVFLLSHIDRHLRKSRIRLWDQEATKRNDLMLMALGAMQIRTNTNGTRNLNQW